MTLIELHTKALDMARNGHTASDIAKALDCHVLTAERAIQAVRKAKIEADVAAAERQWGRT